MQIGQRYNLVAVRESGPGMFLDTGDGSEILLPGAEIPQGLEAGSRVDVFVYRDSEDRPVATTRSPKIMVGQCAYLRVVAVNRMGAFLDWGLPKDLLVPFAQQAERMEAGKSYVVTAYVDRNTDRVVASSRLGRWLQEQGGVFQAGEPVDLLIASRTDLGWKAVINHTHVGLIFHQDAVRPLKSGHRMKGFIKRIRKEDGRIDLAVTRDQITFRRSLGEEIIGHLQLQGGRSDFTDRTPPERIRTKFGVSKGEFKRALGALYRERRIQIHDHAIVLLEPPGKSNAKGFGKRSGNHNNTRSHSPGAGRKTGSRASATGRSKTGDTPKSYRKGSLLRKQGARKIPCA